MLANASFAGGGFLLGPAFFISSAPYVSMLTIEDGTIVTDADSYVAIADVTTYATRYGATWNTADSLANEQAILRAMLYVESFEDEFKGERVSEAQELSWPRAYVENFRGSGYLASDAIPKGLKNAVCEAAIIEMATPGTLLASAISATGSQTVKRLFQKVDVIEKETEYFEGTETAKDERFEKLRAWLEPFIRAATNKVYRG